MQKLSSSIKGGFCAISKLSAGRKEDSGSCEIKYWYQWGSLSYVKVGVDIEGGLSRVKLK